MIVTHTENADARRRVYLGGKASLECWIEPKADGRAWTFHLEEAVTGNRLTEDDRRIWVIHTLLALAEALAVSPRDLRAIPFEAIAALHVADPFASRRVATPRRTPVENGFRATRPDVRRPREDFRHRDDARPRSRM